MHHAASSANLVAQRNDASSGVGAFAPMMFFDVFCEKKKEYPMKKKFIYIYVRLESCIYTKPKQNHVLKKKKQQQQQNIPGVTYFFNNFSASGLIP